MPWLLARCEPQRPERPRLDSRPLHPHRPVPDGLPVLQEIIVVRRQEVTRLADGILESAVVSGDRSMIWR